MKNILKVAILVVSSIGVAHTFAKPVETPIVFKKGTYGTKIKGNFKGYNDARYTVRAQRGQIGSTSADSTGEIILPETGVYTIQVYQMRNSARLGRAVDFNLDLKILNNIKK